MNPTNSGDWMSDAIASYHDALEIRYTKLNAEQNKKRMITKSLEREAHRTQPRALDGPDHGLDPEAEMKEKKGEGLKVREKGEKERKQHGGEVIHSRHFTRRYLVCRFDTLPLRRLKVESVASMLR